MWKHQKKQQSGKSVNGGYVASQETKSSCEIQDGIQIMPGNWQQVALGGVPGARWCWSSSGVTSPFLAEADSGPG